MIVCGMCLESCGMCLYRTIEFFQLSIGFHADINFVYIIGVG